MKTKTYKTIDFMKIKLYNNSEYRKEFLQVVKNGENERSF